MQCDKCDTPFNEGDGNSAVTVMEGIPAHQICDGCHSFKHQLMGDSNMEGLAAMEQSCGFCGDPDDDGYSGS